MPYEFSMYCLSVENNGGDCVCLKTSWKAKQEHCTLLASITNTGSETLGSMIPTL